MVTSENGLLRIEKELSEAERDQLMIRMAELAVTQLEKINDGLYTSKPIVYGRALLESMVFTVSLVIEYGTSIHEVLTGDMEAILQQGREIIEQKKKELKVDWKLMCEDVPPVRNNFYSDTVMNLGEFFDRYNPYIAADQVPCTIDYPLMNPVPETRKGISYVAEYMAKLQMENDFLNSFDPKRIEGMFRRAMPGYSYQFFNMSEPVLTNALGRRILGLEARPLGIDRSLRRKLELQMKDALENAGGYDYEENLPVVREMLRQAATELCGELGLTEACEIDYFSRAAGHQAPRLTAALKHGDLSHVFFDCT